MGQTDSFVHFLLGRRLAHLGMSSHPPISPVRTWPAFVVAPMPTGSQASMPTDLHSRLALRSPRPWLTAACRLGFVHCVLQGELVDCRRCLFSKIDCLVVYHAGLAGANESLLE